MSFTAPHILANNSKNTTDTELCCNSIESWDFRLSFDVKYISVRYQTQAIYVLKKTCLKFNRSDSILRPLSFAAFDIHVFDVLRILIFCSLWCLYFWCSAAFDVSIFWCFAASDIKIFWCFAAFLMKKRKISNIFLYLISVLFLLSKVLFWSWESSSFMYSFFERCVSFSHQLPWLNRV